MAKGDTVYGAHSDNVNQVYSMLGVIGTLGTADVKGTADTLPIGVNPDTGAMYVDVMDTQFNVGTLTVGTINQVGTVGELTGGSVKITAGTITNIGSINTIGTMPAISMGDIPGGTIDEITNGSIKVTAGTVRKDGRPLQNILSYSTTVALAGSAYGTIIGSASVGAGTSMWVNDISLVNQTGTVTCVAGFGAANQGSSVLVRGQFGPNSGIQKSFPLAVNAGMTNQDLTVWSNATANIDVNVSYFISA